ncbi:MAG: hypothetical protein ACRDMZ_12400, partial [Solirubrobacteraceae bacterium]
VEQVVHDYAEDFGPFVMARGLLEAEGRWDEFLAGFGDLVRAFNADGGGAATLRSEYFVITLER